MTAVTQSSSRRSARGAAAALTLSLGIFLGTSTAVASVVEPSNPLQGAFAPLAAPLSPVAGAPIIGSSPEALARSRTAFTELSDAEALASARAILGIDRPLWQRPKRIVRRLDDRAAVVDAPDGSTAVALSSVPLWTRSTTNEHIAVDLSLHKSGAAFAPMNPLVPLRISSGLRDGVQLGPIGFAPMSSKASVSGVAINDKVFFANAQADTDFMVAALPVGAQSFWMLRSPKSPEQLGLELSLPTDAALETDPDAAGGAVIKRGDAVVARIAPPVAGDADGARVPASYQIEGARLRVNVAHRDGEFRYPITVDPAFAVSYGNGPIGNTNTFVGWVPDTNCGIVRFSTTAQVPQSVMIQKGWIPATCYGRWTYTAPGSSYVFEADYANLNHYGGGGNAAWYGLTDAGGSAYPGGGVYYDAYQSYTVASSAHVENAVVLGAARRACTTRAYTAGQICTSTEGTPGNKVFFSLYELSTQTYGADQFAYVYQTTIFLADKAAPAAPTISGIPSGWSKTAPATFRIQGSHGGIGINAFGVKAAGAGYPSRYVFATACNRAYIPPYAPCPQNAAAGASIDVPINGTVPEGVNAIEVDATTPIMGGPTATTALKIDRTPPRIDSVSGSLYDQRDSQVPRDSKTLTDAEYQLHVDTSDAYSGVRRIEVRVDGNLVAAKDGTCGPQGGCPLGLDWTLNTDSLSDGSHTVAITAQDNVADNSPSAPTSFPITVDRQGTVVHAEQWDGAPTDVNSVNQSSQWAVPGSGQARAEGARDTSTLGSAPCSAGVCAQSTTISDEDGDAGDPPAFSRTLGGSANDARVLDAFLTTQTPSDGEQSSGTLQDILASWQTPPPGHGSTYRRYRWSSTAIIDNASMAIVDDLYVDTETSLPVRRDHKEGDAAADESYYDYDKGLLERTTFPSDYFALTKPSPVGSDTTTTLPPEQLSPDPDPAPAEDDLLSRSLASRALLGLTTDQSVVQQIVEDLTSTSRNESMDLVGIPLSSNELTTIKQMFDTQSYGSQLAEFAAANADVYAGAFINAQDQLVVRLTQPSSQLEQALRALIPIGDRLVIAAATMSLSALTATQTQIEADIDSGTLAAYDIQSVGVSQEHGDVVVEITGNSPAAESDLQARYGASVRTIEGQAAVPDRAAHGGLRMNAVDANSLTREEATCTIGPTAYQMVGRKRAYYVLSAGHCGATTTPTPLSWDFASSTRAFPVGPEARSLVRGVPAQTAKIDGLLIKVAPPSAGERSAMATASDRIRLRFGNGSPRYARVKGQAPPLPEKAVICWSGALTGRSQCGRMTGWNRRAVLRGTGLIKYVTTVITRENSDCDERDPGTIKTVVKGDSGGPAFVKKDDELGVRVYGIVSGSGCEQRDDGPFGITTEYERALITQLRGGLTSSFGVSVFCRRYGRPVAGCG